MASLIAEYSYRTQLPFMLVKITEKDRIAAHPGCMSRMQLKLCDMIWMMKTHINADPEWSAAHGAIREFQLERLVWGKFWKEDAFPGEYPTQVNVASLHAPAINIDKALPKPSLAAWVAQRPHPLGCLPTQMPNYPNLPSSLLSVQDYGYTPIKAPAPQEKPQVSVLHGPYENPRSYMLHTPPPAYTFQAPIKQEQGIPATAHPAELGISAREVNNIVRRIKNYKARDYIPQHGWDAITGLPRYAVLNIASDAERNWYGAYGEWFKRLLDEFYPFRIKFQKLTGGKIIAWPEAANVPLYVGGEAWVKFCQLWAFLRTWAEHGNSTGRSENVLQHMEHCRSSWLNFDTTKMIFPPDQEIGYSGVEHENCGYGQVDQEDMGYGQGSYDHVKQEGIEYLEY